AGRGVQGSLTAVRHGRSCDPGRHCRLRHRVTERHPNQRTLQSLPVELRRTTVPPAVRSWIERVTGGRSVERVKRLPGASSTAVHRLWFEDGGPTLVLRRYVWRGFVEAEPDAPPREVDALQFA